MCVVSIETNGLYSGEQKPVCIPVLHTISHSGTRVTEHSSDKPSSSAPLVLQVHSQGFSHTVSR
jgi:hypothetical protein